jgi:hypothetical protein
MNWRGEELSFRELERMSFREQMNTFVSFREDMKRKRFKGSKKEWKWNSMDQEWKWNSMDQEREGDHPRSQTGRTQKLASLEQSPQKEPLIW